MQRLEVIGAVRLMYMSLGVKGLIYYQSYELAGCYKEINVENLRSLHNYIKTVYQIRNKI
jgi:hypothetical protein